MHNPFEDQSSEQSIEHAALPICFAHKDQSSELYTASPISLLDLDRLSEQLSNQDTNDYDLKNSTKQLHQLLKQMKMYAQSLQQRNLEIVCELQKQRSRNKQLMSAFAFLKTSEDQKSKSNEDRVTLLSQISSKYQIEHNRRQMLEAQLKTLRLQNSYLKDLILIANNNYEKLQEKNKSIMERCSSLEQQNNKRQIQMIKKTQEIKSVFTAIVIQKNNNDGKQQPFKIKNQNIPTINNTVNFNNFKSVRKQQTDDAYRTIFMKTLKPKKQNIHKQI